MNIRTHLGSRTCEIRTEHDDPWGSVREFFSTSLEAIFKELEIATTTVTTFLIFDLVLHYERFVRKVDRFWEWCRDGVMGSLVLCDKTLVTDNDWAQRVFDFPFANVAEGLSAYGSLLRGF